MKTLVIHTGGTIGMVQSDLGYTPEAGVVEGCLSDLQRTGHISGDITLVVASPLIDSANAAPSDWNWIARQIAENYGAYDAFVITHGTDTMAYTASALCFALVGLNKPVILTGAMLPLTVEGSDGRRNLTDALQSVQSCPPGVWVQFAGRLLHGARVRKSHSMAFDAFDSTPSTVPPRHRAANFHRLTYSDFDVPILAVAPGMSAATLQFCATSADGIVLRCYGSGTMPAHPPLIAALQLAQDRGIPVIAVSQCAEGGIAFGTYAAGGALRQASVFDGRDCTVESGYAKLLSVLSRGLPRGARDTALTTPICGEFAAD